MKAALSLLLLLAILAGGCATPAREASHGRGLIDLALSSALPPGFEGDAFFSTRITYGVTTIKVTIRAGGLKRGAAGWEWKWLAYSGESPLTYTQLVFGPVPPTIGVFP